jgi:hypothetical protein
MMLRQVGVHNLRMCVSAEGFDLPLFRGWLDRPLFS